MGDRGGGREVKGASLRTSKKNPGAASARTKKDAGETVLVNLPPPASGPGAHVDCGAALISRLFDRDRDRMLQRTRAEGHVSAVVVWSSDVSKQQSLADLCKEHEGLCYFVVGFHPDNVGRGAANNQEKTWVKAAEQMAMRPECVGVLSGLHLNREIGTHFAQKSVLAAAARLCAKWGLPLVLHLAGDEASFEQAVEILQTEGWLDGSEPSHNRRVLVHDAITSLGANPHLVGTAVKLGMVLSVSGHGISSAVMAEQATEAVVENGINAVAARACVAAIPLRQLVACSDSPWRTPQNLDDEYLRSQRNEPANLPFVVRAIAAARAAADLNPGDADPEALTALHATLKENALRVFGLDGFSASAGLAREAANSAREARLVQLGTDFNEPQETDAAAEEDEVDRDEEKEEAAEGNEDETNAEKLAELTVGLGRGAHYCCRKCRGFLFDRAAAREHGARAPRTFYRDGSDAESLCGAVVFLRHIKDEAEDESLRGVRSVPKGLAKKGGGDGDGGADSCVAPFVVRGSSVECGRCAAKLGRYNAAEGTCTCGAAVAGPAVRFTVAKIDFLSGPAKLLAVVERSRQEAEQFEDEEGKDQAKDKRKKRGRKKLQVTGPDGLGLGRNLQRGTAPKGSGHVGGR